MVVLRVHSGVAVFLLARSNPLPAYENQSIHYQWPIWFCPICGANIREWLDANPIEAEHWLAKGALLRHLVFDLPTVVEGNE